MWDWTPKVEKGFAETKRAVSQGQTLQVTDYSILFPIYSVCQHGWIWVGFWSHLQKREEIHYSLLEKQLATVYAILLATEGIRGIQAV